MHTKIALVGLSAILLGTAVPLLAQEPPASDISIEDFLLQNVMNGGGEPNGRITSKLFDIEAANTNTHRAEAAAAALAAQAAASSEAAMHAAANPEPEPETLSAPTDSATVSINGEQITLSAVDLRALLRLQKDRTTSSTALHSGAPLAPTGPGAVVGWVALMIAMVGTFIWSWKMDKPLEIDA